jgi:AhpD family alkylhydroperoxidase
VKNVREMLNDLQNGMAAVSDEDTEFMKQFSGLQKKTFENSAISKKEKELIAVAIAVYSRCEYCIVYHVYSAFGAGATRAEIIDAAKVAIGGFGGGPSLAYASTLLMASVNEFEKDF